MSVVFGAVLGGFATFQDCSSGTKSTTTADVTPDGSIQDPQGSAAAGCLLSCCLLLVTSCFQPFASFRIDRALAGKLSGGCLYTLGDVDFTGHASFTRCSAVGDGGGVAAKRVVSHESANVTFANCTAKGQGGFVQGCGFC